jgi:hypothetical protein
MAGRSALLTGANSAAGEAEDDPEDDERAEDEPEDGQHHEPRAEGQLSLVVHVPIFAAVGR